MRDVQWKTYEQRKERIVQAYFMHKKPIKIIPCVGFCRILWFYEYFMISVPVPYGRLRKIRKYFLGGNSIHFSRSNLLFLHSYGTIPYIKMMRHRIMNIFLIDSINSFTDSTEFIVGKLDDMFWSSLAFSLNVCDNHELHYR